VTAGTGELAKPGRDLALIDIIGLALLGGLAVWMVASLIVDPVLFAKVTVIGISNGSLYALVALGYTMVYGIIELINFAHGEVFMLGSIVAAIFMEDVFNQTSSNPTGWVLLILTMVITMIICAALNMLIERLAYRRLRNAPRLAPLITAVGVSYVLQNVGQELNGTGSQRSRSSVLPDTEIHLGPIDIGVKYLLVLAITVPLLLAMTWLVQKTKVGKAMRATAQDRDASRLMGINVDRIISYTFGIGGALAAAAGLMAFQINESTRYDAGFRFGLVAFTAAVIGGVGNLAGAVLGGYLIGIIYALTEGAKLFPGPEWVQTMVFLILIAFVTFRPGGIFGSNETEKV
jgi:branched-chain amino acid transport system permease protein